MAISGDYAIVGAAYEAGGDGDPISRAGAAYVFARNQGDANNWSQVEKLTAGTHAQKDGFFGRCVAVSGDYAIVAAPAEDGGGGDGELQMRLFFQGLAVFPSSSWAILTVSSVISPAV